MTTTTRINETMSSSQASDSEETSSVSELSKADQVKQATVRIADTDAEWERLNALFERAFGEPMEGDKYYYTQEWWYHALAYVMEINGKLVGALVYYDPERYWPPHLTKRRKPSRFYVELVGVDPNWQRLGVGTALFEKFLSYVDNRNMMAEIHVEVDNERALQLYSKMGFKSKRIDKSKETARFDGQKVYVLLRQPGERNYYCGPAICFQCSAHTQLCDDALLMPFCSSACRTDYFESIQGRHRCIHNHWKRNDPFFVDNLDFTAIHNTVQGVTILKQTQFIQVGVQYLPANADTGYEVHEYETQFIRVVSGYGAFYFASRPSDPFPLGPGEVVLVEPGTSHRIQAQTALKLTTVYSKHDNNRPFSHILKSFP